jgi:hypothetical protein
MFEKECHLITEMTRIGPKVYPFDIPIDLDWSFVKKTLIENRLAGLAFWRITQTKIDIPGLEELEAHFRTNQFQNMMLLEEAERILEALNKSGIEVLLTKGLILLGTIYPLGVRRMGDIDLLVRPSQSKKAFNLFEKMGYKIGHKDRSSELGGKNSFDLYLLKGQQAIMIDMAWEFLDNPGRKSETAPDMEKLFEKARPLKLGAVDGRALDPVDQIIHTAAHVSLHHDLNYLPGLIDLAALLSRAETLDWGELEDRAAFFNLRNAVVCSLGVIKEIYGLKIGEPILKNWQILKRKVYRSPAVLFFDRLWVLGAEQESILGNKKGGIEKKLALTYFKESLMDSLTARWSSRWRKIRPDRARIWKAYRVYRPLWAVQALGFVHVVFYSLFLLIALPILQVLRPILGVLAIRRQGRQGFL